MISTGGSVHFVILNRLLVVMSIITGLMDKDLWDWVIDGGDVRNDVGL